MEDGRESLERELLVVDDVKDTVVEPTFVPDKNSKAKRFVTFNVCGIKNVLNFKPWNEKKSFESMFEILDADVVCFQETKIQQRDVIKSMAVVKGYNAFFTFPVNKKGYSGVAIYVKNDIPVYKAEHGLTGWVESQDVRVMNEESGQLQSEVGLSYRELEGDKAIGGYPENIDQKTGLAIDSEGRCVVLDLGYCVVIGLYCPADSMGDRTEFRSGFFETLDIRVRKLIESGRRVVVLGDLNVTREIIDSAPGRQEWIKEGKLSAGATDITINQYLEDNITAATLWRNATNERKIFHNFLNELELIDTTRYINPNKWSMYTCWNQVIDARPGNFGSRIDYILITKDLQCVDGDILPQLYGSDHCPVYGDILWNEETNELPKLPRMCTIFMPQFIEKQGNIRKLFSSYNNSDSGRNSASPLPSIRSITTQPIKTSLKQQKVISKPKVKSKSQPSILSFWKKPTENIKTTPTPPPVTPTSSILPVSPVLAVSSQPPESVPNQASSNEWKKIFSPATPPLCNGHQEPCKLLISKKNGVNKGRAFWICARPTGAEANGNSISEFRCGYFKWYNS